MAQDDGHGLLKRHDWVLAQGHRCFLVIEAVAAGVSVRDVHRMIDKRILPDRLFDTTDWRLFALQSLQSYSLSPEDENHGWIGIGTIPSGLRTPTPVRTSPLRHAL